MEEYIDSQTKLRAEIQKIRQEQTRQHVQKIIDEGGTKSTTFWRTKRKICGKTGNADYTTIDEHGNHIEDPEEAKEHIASYYENLYQARECRAGYEAWTEEIKNTIEKIEKSEEMKKPVQRITHNELKKTVKKTKKWESHWPRQHTQRGTKRSQRRNVGKIQTSIR